MKIKVLYEDKDVLVIDKPSGISVHPDGKSKEKTITDWVLKNYPKMKNVGEPMCLLKTSEEAQNFSSCALPRVRGGTLGDKNFELLPRPGIVHRLDKDTSGVLLLAKNQKAYEFLKDQFKNREIKKTYNAIVSGWVKNDHGIINKPIGRSPSDFRRRLAGRGARGELREAITEYKVLKRFENKKREKFTYLEVKPKTGRTHQIRVHMKFLNHPVVCDSLYDPKGLCIKGIDRLALHAKSIEFC
ncbi:MAG: RluA family pseudouridine synthase, partial [Minisyncoccia bacterium]